MEGIGIIANPASGKDIRRLVAHATVIDNNEKLDIVRRVILGAQVFGIKNIYIMPDSFHIGYKVKDSLQSLNKLNSNIEIINIDANYTLEDTVKTARAFEDMGISCIVSIGGDGTNRAIAKAVTETPILPISTGTNNTYPEMIEGTIAGIAAAIISKNNKHKKELCVKDKRIEIYRDKKMIDIALIDVVISKDTFIGAKAIWNISNIRDIIVTQAHPSSIGFSSIVGYITRVEREDDFGIYLDLKNPKNPKFKVSAPVAPGVIEKIPISDYKRINIGDQLTYIFDFPATLALDGEREIEIRKNDEITFKITRNGPYKVEIRKTLEWAEDQGFFAE